MTLTEIAQFKHFCNGHSITKLFIHNYRKQIKKTKNPASIEMYLSSVEPHLAIKSAFKVYYINSAYGFDWWCDMSDSWIKYMEEQSANISYNKNQETSLYGLYSILRQNWDSSTFWKKEDINVAKKRIGIITPDANQKNLETDMPQEIKYEPSQYVACNN